MENRAAWILAVVAFAFIALLMIVMAQSLDTKAPIRIDRRGPPLAEPTATPETAAEAAAREEAVLKAIVERRAPELAGKAAAQAFAAEDLARARCTFTGATLVSRTEDAAYWRLDYSCADAKAPEALPNLTSVSVRLVKDGLRWVAEP